MNENNNSELLSQIIELKTKLDMHLTISHKVDEKLSNTSDKFIALEKTVESLSEKIEALEKDRIEHCNILHKGTDREPSIKEQLAIIRKEGQDREKKQNLIWVILAVTFAAIQAWPVISQFFNKQ